MLPGVSEMADLTAHTAAVRAFAEERDWVKFHDPKSLVLALVGEVGEVAELLQWLPASEAAELARAEPLRQRMGEELADVLIYLVRLADVVGVDLVEAAMNKLADSGRRFPVDQVSGVAPSRP